MENQQSEAVPYPNAQLVAEVHEPVRNLACLMLKHLLNGYRGRAKVRLWDGADMTPDSGEEAVLNFLDPAPIRELFIYGDLVRLAEAYLTGHLEVEGDMVAVYDIVDYLLQRRFTWREKLGLGLKALRMPRKRVVDDARNISAGRLARGNSRISISYHYDVSNDFYRLWLDRNMTYSCAYFKNAEQGLDQAQESKIDHICRKLRLSPGQKLLDIGCGWGALAIWAAENYDVEVKGITLSKQQYLHARDRVEMLGLKRRVSIELMDYRDLPENLLYDRVVSVGMFEHVGIAQFPVYFGKVRRILKPEGVFLNHGITNDTGWDETPTTRFCNQYVFPDGELTRVSEVQQAMEEAGFEVLDVEGLRLHYAKTLEHWIQNLERHHADAVRLTSEMTYRVWRLYMAGSAHFFHKGSLGLYQILAGHRYQTPAIPLTRADIYS